MKVALICEKSGVVREAFKKHGHYAVSYDIEPNQSRDKWEYDGLRRADRQI